jgi:hypothetical protein
VLESTGDHKTIRRRNLRIVSSPQQQRPSSSSQQQRNTVSSNTIKTEDLTRSEVAAANANTTETAPTTASETAATAPSPHQERGSSYGHTDEVAAAVPELSQLALDFSLLMARLGVIADTLNRRMSDNR